MPSNPTKASQLFYQWVWPIRADLLRLARMLCGNHVDAEDLVQETLLKAFSAIETFQAGTDPRAWLMRILRNARIDRIRKLGREPGNVSLDSAEVDIEARQDVENFGSDPAKILGAFSDQQIIDALQDLPEEIRMTLLLVDVEQVDHAAAAAVLDVPVGTIKSRAHRGRAMLRESLLPLAKDLRLVD